MHLFFFSRLGTRLFTDWSRPRPHTHTPDGDAALSFNFPNSAFLKAPNWRTGYRMNAARCAEPAKTLGRVGLTRAPPLKLSRESGLITTWPLLNKYCAYRCNYKGAIDASQAVLKRKDGGLVQLQPKVQPVLPLLHDICASQSGSACKEELKRKRLCVRASPASTQAISLHFLPQ